MPWSLQYGAMLHLQVMQEKQQQWTNDKLTHLSFFVYYKKNFFVSFCSFFSQKNTLIIIMIINIFIFNHRFTDCFLSFFLSFFRSWCTLIICCLGWNQETKGKRWVSLDASFSRSRCWGLDRSRQASKRYYHVSVLNFNSSLNHKTLYIRSQSQTKIIWRHFLILMTSSNHSTNHFTIRRYFVLTLTESHQLNFITKTSIWDGSQFALIRKIISASLYYSCLYQLGME